MSVISEQLNTLLSTRPSWTGTASELFNELDTDGKGDDWPTTPGWLVRKLKGMKAELEKVGIQIEEKRVGKERNRILVISKANGNADIEADVKDVVRVEADTISEADITLADVISVDSKQADTISQVADGKADTICESADAHTGVKPADPIPPPVRIPSTWFCENINHPTERIIPDPNAPRPFNCDGCDWLDRDWCRAVKPGCFYAVKHLVECPLMVPRAPATHTNESPTHA